MDPHNDAKDDVSQVEKDRTPSSASSDAKPHDGSSAGAERTDSEAVRAASAAAKLKNPLIGMSERDILRDVDAFVESKGLSQHREAFHKGAMLARVGQRDDGFEQLTCITEQEKDLLRYENQHRWSQPFMLYFLVVLCAGSAIVQGTLMTRYVSRKCADCDHQAWIRLPSMELR